MNKSRWFYGRRFLVCRLDVHYFIAHMVCGRLSG
jgi:hypothetical protein